MTGRSLLVAATLLAGLLPAARAVAEWRTSLWQDFVAEQSRPHPRRRTLILRVPVDAPHGAQACWTYANGRTDEPDRGSVKVRVQITRQESPTGPLILIDRLRFGKVPIRTNNAADCGPLVPLRGGDVAVFSFRFTKAPPLLVIPDDLLESRFQFSGEISFRE